MTAARQLRARRRWAAAALALLALVAGACGVGPQEEATRVDPADVPFGLLAAETTTTVDDATEPATVYLVAAERLVAVDRAVSEDGDLADVLELLVAGPTETERSLGITTAVPSGVIESVAARRGVATVALDETFGDVRSDEQLLALAQVVYTLTQQPGIGGVAFTLDGEDVAVPLPDGTELQGAVSRDDLDVVAPA